MVNAIAKGRFWAGTMDDWLKEPTGALYRLGADLSVHRLIDSIGIPHSLAWSPDNRRFYFADTMDRAIYQFDYDHETGAISDKRMFASTMSDPGNPHGSTIDAEGFLWNAQ
jgi:L-arabinonolactonase